MPYLSAIAGDGIQFRITVDTTIRIFSL